MNCCYGFILNCSGSGIKVLGKRFSHEPRVLPDQCKMAADWQIFDVEENHLQSRTVDPFGNDVTTNRTCVIFIVFQTNPFFQKHTLFPLKDATMLGFQGLGQDTSMSS